MLMNNLYWPSGFADLENLVRLLFALAVRQSANLRFSKRGLLENHSLRIYPYPMVWPLPRPWSESPSEHRKP